MSAKTYKSDAALPRLVPTSLAALQVGAVTDREVSRALIALVRSGLAESSVKRFPRLVVCVLRLGGARANDPDKSGHADPGTESLNATVEMYPSARRSWKRFYVRAVRPKPAACGHLCSSTPGPACAGPSCEPFGCGTSSRCRCRCWWLTAPSRRVCKSRATKSDRSRRVPMADRVLPLIRALLMAAGRMSGCCVTESGHRLHATGLQAHAGLVHGRGGPPDP